mgnify:CR=1 FL=1
MIGVERKQLALDVFNIAKEALSKATKFVVSLTPYGVFAIAANTAGRTANFAGLVLLAITAVAFLLSDDSGMMTGSVIDFDQSVIGAFPFAPPSPPGKMSL